MYIPNVLLAGTEKPSDLPFLKARFVADKTLFYVCQNRTCEIPTNNLEKVVSDLI
jgi:uncharacterized protein YyaL (SSP411 family)